MNSNPFSRRSMLLGSLGLGIGAAAFETLVKQAFSQRRKTLRNTLRELLYTGGISRLGIDPAARAESLEIDAFAALANRLHELRQLQKSDV